MNKPAAPQAEENKVSFVVSFEGVHGILADIQAYLFDASGALIMRQSVRKGRAAFALADHSDQQVYVVLAPLIDDMIAGPVTLASIRGFHAFEVKTRLDPCLAVHFLPEVPESVWRWWLVHSLWPALSRRSDWQASAALIL